MEDVILLLGGNLGNREDYLNRAKALITPEVGTITATSSFYESEPWGFEDKNLFLNQAIRLKTGLSPEKLIKILLKIEKSLGRTRNGSVSSREIDIDILFYGEKEINTSQLTIPHPRIKERMFTLLPLKELTEDKLLPVLNKTASDLMLLCNDTSTAYLFNSKKKG